MGDGPGQLVWVGDQQELDVSLGQLIDDVVQGGPAFGVQAQKGVIKDEEVGCAEQGYGKLYPFVFTVGELDQWFLQQGADVQEPDQGGIRVWPTCVGDLLCNGDGLVRVRGVEALLVVELGGAGSVSEAVLLFYYGYVVGERDPAGIEMLAEEGMGQDGLAAAGWPRKGPVLAFGDHPIEVFEERGTAYLYGDPFDG